MNDITEQIRARAAKAGIGINDLHKRAGVSGNTLWRWGKMVEKPRQAIIDKFEKVLKQVENEHE